MDTTASPSRIGHRVRKLRELRNLTQEHMAGVLDMSLSGYSRIERDEVRIDSGKLSKISKELGVSVDDILNFDERLMFNNHGTLQGYAFAQSFAHNPVLNDVAHLESLYREQIEALKAEVQFLREELRKRG